MAIEKKMKKHNIVKNLVAVLDADNPDLLSVVLLFLKKLSIIKENKDEMVRKEMKSVLSENITNLTYQAQRGVVTMLARLLQAPAVHEGHVLTALRLLLNLSFSSVLQQLMANAALIPHLVNLKRQF